VLRKERKKERYFHINLYSRKKYEVEESLFSLKGNIVIADAKQARILSQKINTKRSVEPINNQPTTPGQIKALGILHEIFHFVISYYQNNENPRVFGRLLNDVQSHFGVMNTEVFSRYLLKEFPPTSSLSEANHKRRIFEWGN